MVESRRDGKTELAGRGGDNMSQHSLSPWENGMTGMEKQKKRLSGLCQGLHCDMEMEIDIKE